MYRRMTAKRGAQDSRLRHHKAEIWVYYVLSRAILRSSRDALRYDAIC